MGMLTRYPLIYSGIGIYEPLSTPQGIQWHRNTDGNPLYGIHVNSIRDVRKFAELARIEGYEMKEWLQ
jgi:hypothetical protein